MSDPNAKAGQPLPAAHFHHPSLFQRPNTTKRPGGIKVVVASPAGNRTNTPKNAQSSGISSDMPREHESNVVHRPVSNNNTDDSPKSSESASPETLRASYDSKRTKFQKILSEPIIELEELKKLSWSGIPKENRAIVWMYLLDYLPTNSERRQSTLERKRQEYSTYVDRYFGSNTIRTEEEEVISRQILLDLPRTLPNVPLFQQKLVQAACERILYVWSIRHPASGYVQGINDLLAPFLVVFLAQFTDENVETFDSSTLSRDQLDIAEADSFWCLSKLIDSIQDNYTFAQPGIQRQVYRLSELVNRVEHKLHVHLTSLDIQYIQFSFRWMNCLLIREVPLSLVIRMWDTYLAEENGFVDYHLYVCAAFLRVWSQKLQMEDFQGCIILLQNLPTQSWKERDVELLLSDAYQLKTYFHNAPSHLKN